MSDPEPTPTDTPPTPEGTGNGALAATPTVKSIQDDIDQARVEAADLHEQIQDVKQEVAADPEITGDHEQMFYESGTEHPELDDQTIAPPG